MNKNLINNILRKFGVQVHGIGYLEKLSKNSFKNDPFQEQKKFFEGNEVLQIVDAGANVGDVSRKYNELFPKASIHAFEPIPEAINKFKEKHQNNPNIHLNEMGVSNSVSRQTLNINKSIDTSSLLESKKIGATSDKFCETVEQIDIELITLNNYLSKEGVDKVDILKIDTQGSELNILKGADQFLSSGKISLIFTEIYFKQQYENQATFHEIASYLASHNYQLKDFYELFYNEKQVLWGDAIFVHSSYL